MGVANPDSLAIDRRGNVWMVTDRSCGSTLDVFGTNSCWLFPAGGPGAGEPLLFTTGPMECELCGPCFDSSESTLSLAVQHPGATNGTHRRGDEAVQAHTPTTATAAASSSCAGCRGPLWWRSAAAQARCRTRFTASPASAAVIAASSSRPISPTSWFRASAASVAFRARAAPATNQPLARAEVIQ